MPLGRMIPSPSHWREGADIQLRVAPLLPAKLAPGQKLTIQIRQADARVHQLGRYSGAQGRDLPRPNRDPTRKRSPVRSQRGQPSQQGVGAGPWRLETGALTRCKRIGLAVSTAYGGRLEQRITCPLLARLRTIEAQTWSMTPLKIGCPAYVGRKNPL